MAMISDILLMAGALGAAFYCYVLASRLRRFTDLERGVGGAVAVLSAQVDDLSRTLALAREVASGSSGALAEQTARAEAAGRRLELLVAAMHDLPDPDLPSEARQIAPSESVYPGDGPTAQGMNAAGPAAELPLPALHGLSEPAEQALLPGHCATPESATRASEEASTADTDDGLTDHRAIESSPPSSARNPFFLRHPSLAGAQA